MAIGVIVTFDGGTLEQYDETCRLMGYEQGGAGAPGSLFHWVAAVDGGIRVTDVWETRADFERFAEEKIAPSTQAAGFAGPPRVEFFDVHNYYTAGSPVAV
jgi:hypothetical protein